MIQYLYYVTSLKKHICLDKPVRESEPIKQATLHLEEPIMQAILQLENAYVLSFSYKCELEVLKQMFICM